MMKANWKQNSTIQIRNAGRCRFDFGRVRTNDSPRQRTGVSALRQRTARTIGALIVVSFSVAGGAAIQGQEQAAAVVVTAVVEREVAAGHTYLGTITPRRRSTIGCAVAGRVEHFLVDQGDLVTWEAATPNADDAKADGADAAEPIGQAVVELRTKTIDITIAAAKAERTIRENEAAQLKTSLPELIAQAKAKTLGTAAAAKYAESNQVRVEALFQRDRAVSDSDREQAQSVMIVAKQEHAAALATLRELETTQEARITQADARLLLQDEEIRRLEDLKSKYTIRAPFEGYVVAKFTEVGNWVKEGDPIIEIVEVNPVEIIVPVPVEHIEKLQQDLAAHRRDQRPLNVGVQIDALRKGLFAGEVINIIPQADLRSRAIPVMIRVANPREENGHRIQPGMLAKISLAVGGQQKSLLVPKDALVLGGASPVVFVVDGDAKSDAHTARAVPVELGAAFDALIEVRGPLKKDDRVVTVGNERLRPGQPVRIVPK